MKKKGVRIDYLVGTMIELPRAALIADEIAKEAEFFSFGTNDLTQTTFGFSPRRRGQVHQLLHGEEHPRKGPFPDPGPGRRGPAREDGRDQGPRHPAEPQGRHLRRARRRPGQRGVLLQDRAQLRELLALPRADRAAGRGARQAQGKGRGRIRDEVTLCVIPENWYPGIQERSPQRAAIWPPFFVAKSFFCRVRSTS